jgi:hypothetical protein
MMVFYFYRFYAALCAGFLLYFFVTRNIFLSVLAAVFFRLLWLGMEKAFARIRISRDYTKHQAAFKQEFGPYGIRIANLAQAQWRVKASLAEVFCSRRDSLQKAVEQLEVMGALFKAGMRPEGDDFLLHDLKLTYGKKRLSAAKDQ